MAKKPKEVVENEYTGEMIEVDILNTEMTEGLPHWLDPMLKYSSTHDVARRAKQRQRSMEIQANRKRK